jgi:ribosome-binding ATPase YchF (GTP1/OBG family)
MSCARTRRASCTPRAASTRSHDIETIETELMLADLEQAERRLDRVTRVARGGDRQAIAELAWLEQVVAALAGAPARSVPPPETPATRCARSA